MIYAKPPSVLPRSAEPSTIMTAGMQGLGWVLFSRVLGTQVKNCCSEFGIMLDISHSLFNFKKDI